MWRMLGKVRKEANELMIVLQNRIKKGSKHFDRLKNSMCFQLLSSSIKISP